MGTVGVRCRTGRHDACVNPAFQSKELAYVLGQSKSVGLIAAPAYGITILSGGSGGGAG